MGAHTNTNFLTLVLQDGVGGLQASSQGRWIDVLAGEAGASTLVCNLGEQAEILTKGYFRATPHRVLRHVGSDVPRTSVPLFYNPMLSAVVRQLEGIKTKLPWERNDEGGRRHWRMDANAMLGTMGENTFKSLARSHPDMFRRHHKDLE